MKNNPQEQYYIICSDIRQFKVINDIFGPEAGDRILRTIADSIRDADDHNRVYGRISGDSFAICMPAILVRIVILCVAGVRFGLKGSIILL